MSEKKPSKKLLAHAREVVADDPETPPELAIEPQAATLPRALYHTKTKKLILSAMQHGELLRQIRNGQPLNVAAPLAGIPVREMNRWLERGNYGEEPFKTLVVNVERARAELFRKVYNVLLQAMMPRGVQEIRDKEGRVTGILPAREGDHKVAQFILERQFPEFMGEKQTVTVQLNDQAAMFFDIAERVLDPQSYQRLVSSISGTAPSGSSEAEGDPVH